MVKVKSIDDVPRKAVEVSGVNNVFIRRMISRADGASNFAMRLFEVEPSGYTPLHRHAHEHEVFVLSGRGAVKGSWGEIPLMDGSAVYVPAQEEHHFVNMGDEPLCFLCVVPVAADK